MHLGSRRQRILLALGLLLVIVPIIGLPIFVKNILIILGGLFLVGFVLIAVDQHQEKAEDRLSEKKEESLPSVYHEQVPEFYVEPEVPQKFSHSLLADKPTTELVPSPLKTKTVRRRVVKNTKLKPIEDHATVI